MSAGRAVGAYAELAFHMLACVPVAASIAPLAAAASLHDARYVAWSGARSAPVELIGEDAPVLSSLLSDPRAMSTISLLALLHDSLDSFVAGAARPLADLGATDVSSPAALQLLLAVGSPSIEIVRADMALDSRAFENFFYSHAKPRIDAVLGRLADVPRAASRPAWLRFDAELSLALGVHGRVFGTRVIVGAGLPEEPLDAAAARAHALIGHERAVVSAHDVLGKRGLPTEWAWIEATSIAIERALVERGALPRSHRAWLESLSLEGLADLPRSLEAELVRDALEAT